MVCDIISKELKLKKGDSKHDHLVHAVLFSPIYGTYNHCILNAGSDITIFSFAILKLYFFNNNTASENKGRRIECCVSTKAHTYVNTLQYALGSAKLLPSRTCVRFFSLNYFACVLYCKSNTF